MPPSTVLILEDDEDRLRAFRSAMGSLGPAFSLHHWCNAPAMIADCPLWLPQASLISLDHDLNRVVNDGLDPGTGLDVAVFLARHKPVFPVILHTGNLGGQRWMLRELHAAGWWVEVVLPQGTDWVQRLWLRSARKLVGR